MAEEQKEKWKFGVWWKEYRRTHRFARILTNKYFLATFIFLLFVTVIDSNNIIRWGRIKFQATEQRGTIRQYEKQIQDTEEKLNELTSNKDSLEKYAREQYFFQNKDEEVFIVE